MKLSRKDGGVDISFPFSLEGTTFNRVIHCAGKAHSYPRTQEEINQFYHVNTLGTQNLLNALDANKLQSFIFVSTVAVYGDFGNDIRESSPLSGNSPYAKSKIRAESLVRKWGLEKGVATTIFRIPLLIGKNAPGNLGKMTRAIHSSTYFTIAGGKARKSMVLLPDVVNLVWRESLPDGVFNIASDEKPSFKEMELSIAQALNLKTNPSLPLNVGRFLGLFGDLLKSFPVNSETIRKMTEDFTVDNTLAKERLNWKPSMITTEISKIL